MTYKLGVEGKYSLSEKAIKHIIDGDFSDRQSKDKNGNTVLTKIIAGGLHTMGAWENFIKHRQDVKHALLFNPKKNENWYYARELQNEVILLKIPKNCFKSKAANITKFPQTYYKSGYLWKSLFPLKFSKSDIINAIDEALLNIDRNESNDSLLIGYFNKSDIFKSIKIRIQIRGNEILSAFPTWGQPMTGNNGKPFSHIDSINTIISSSTIFGNDDENKYLSNTLKKWNIVTINYFIKNTPNILKNRKIPKKTKDRIQQYEKRNKELISYGESLSEKEIKSLYNLCNTEEYKRHTMDFIRFAYELDFKRINKYLKIRNSLSLYQNLQELLIIINAWDLKNQKTYAFKIIKNILEIRFIRTGGVDQWEMKRLSNLILKIVESYKKPRVSLEFIENLVISPLRIAFYVEFNLNPYFNSITYVIGLTENEKLPLNDKHFYDYVVQNLGINYTENFEDDFNIAIAKKIQTSENKNGFKIIKYLIPFSVGSDFNYFSNSILNICHQISLNNSSIKQIEQFVFDYHRCIAANIIRVIAKNKEILRRDLDYGDKDFIKYTKVNHEHKFLWFLNKMLIEELSKLYRKNNFTTEADDLEKKYLSIYKEVRKIPTPKSIPEYLESDEGF